MSALGPNAPRSVPGRADRLLDRLADRDLGALLVTDLVNARYLTGFTGSNGLAVITPERRVFVSDFRYVEQAADELTDFEFHRGPRDLFAAIAELVPGGPLRLGFDDLELSVRRHGELRALLPDEVELVGAGGIVEELRRAKEPDELARIGAAAALADEAMRTVLERRLVGRTEREVAFDLEMEMRRRGAEAVSFPSIVAAGPHGALPHAEPREVRIPPDTLVVLDWGAQLDGYCSDCTRTVATGEGIDADMREVYELVRRAQAEAGEAVAPGQGAEAVDRVSREPIEAAGHGDHYGHGLGHGVGLEVHEAPRLGPRSRDVLAENDVVSVEPGVYLPGRFGVRIEDLVAVAPTGADVFSSLPKDLTVVG